MPTLTSVAEVLVRGNIFTAEGRSQAVEQVYHYTFRVTYNPSVLPTLLQIANAVTTSIAQPMLSILQSDYVWSSTAARWLDDVTVANVLGSTTIGSSTISTARLPSDVTARCRLTTGTRGKSFKGGKSYRPIPEASVAGDTFTTAAQGPLNTFAADLFGPISVAGQTMYPCIVSRKDSQLQTNPTTIIGDIVLNAVFNLSLGTMKGKHRRAVP